MPRSVLALTAIVAVVAISLGIKDHVKQKEAKPPASTSTPTAVHSNVPKKITSAKTGRARMSATEANAPATAQAAADEKPLISEEFAKAGAKATGVISKAPNTVRAQAAHDVETAMERNQRVCNELARIAAAETATPALSPAQFLSLPNLTKPGDVDAAYYQNWAREYCEFVGVEAEDRRQ